MKLNAVVGVLFHFPYFSELIGPSSKTTLKTSVKMADTSHFGRLAGTAIVVLGVAGAFLYFGGWFNSEALTPGRFADGFERADGIYSGFRLNHAKGVCVTALSRATAGARAFQRP